jgi:4-amino-4-deoxy-L-arabinose transferase-like glycosyltransferase
MNLNFIKSPCFFLILALVLAIPAFLIYLGLIPFIDDESIRAMVAFEMIQSGDYVSPTIGGELYLKKPPLYNWIIILFFRIFNNHSEFTQRLPMVAFIFVFTLTIFYFVRKELGTRMGILAALMFLTNGRVLFYESLHGLIDISFSWLTYLFFMVSYSLMKREKYLALFLSAYAITAISYLMKGLPSLVFLAISLLVLFISQRKFRILLGWKHIAGIVLLVLVVGTYYFIYFTRNHIEPDSIFSTLLGETTRRTVVRFGWERTVLHLFTFPFEMFYHFFPWTILVILLFRKGGFRLIRANPFLNYSLLIIIFNVIVYWTSPEVHARYVLMLTPLFYTILGWLYLEYKKENTLWTRVLDAVFLGLLLFMTVSMWVPLFIEPVSNFPLIGLTSFSLFALLAFVTFSYWKQHNNRLLWVVIALLVIRIGFNLTILPARYLEAREIPSRELARQIARESKGTPMYIWWNPSKTPDPYYGKRRVDYPFMYYIATERNEVLRFSSEVIPGALYIADPADIHDYPVEILKEFTPYGHQEPVVLMRFVSGQP